MFRPPVSRARLRTLAAGLAIALLPIGATLASATAPQAAQAAQATQVAQATQTSPAQAAGPVRHLRRRRHPLRRRPQHHARAVRRLQRPAVPGPATLGQRGQEHRRRPAQRVPPGCGRYADAAAQDRFCADTTCLITTLYDQSAQAQRPHPAAARRLQRTGDGRLRQPADRRHGTRSPSTATRRTASSSSRAWACATTTPAASRSTTSPRACTGSSTASTSTTAAASTTATPRSTAATTATAPWRPATSATLLPGTTAPATAPGS